MKSLITLAIVSLLSTAHGRTLIISDIDDTIKVSHILDHADKVVNALNITVPFTGMAQLYTLLNSQDPQNTKIVYLSNAPKTVAGIPVLLASHSAFLEFNKFPPGSLNLREDIMDPNHKINEIRKLINDERPDQVILFGDNGERDPEIYHQAQIEFGSKVRMQAYIHQLYTSQKPFFIPAFLAEKGKPIFAEQIGYVTPVEVSTDLYQKQLLSAKNYEWMIKNVSPFIVSEGKDKKSMRSVSFPSFKKCKDFVWKLKLTPELTGIYNKIKKECY
ncbi:MAG: hypothetical protein K0R29_2903 [Pseudobdellovibrio sp.]|nr:hypothetical protein [Pseudobdellovibrio sp.]